MRRWIYRRQRGSNCSQAPLGVDVVTDLTAIAKKSGVVGVFPLDDPLCCTRVEITDSQNVVAGGLETINR